MSQGWAYIDEAGEVLHTFESDNRHERTDFNSPYFFGQRVPVPGAVDCIELKDVTDEAWEQYMHTLMGLTR